MRRYALLFSWLPVVGGSALAQVCPPHWSDEFPLSALSGAVRALTTMRADARVQLVAGGDFSFAGGLPANHVARWDGDRWLPFGGGLDWPVHALAVFDDGSGPALYAGGGNAPQPSSAPPWLARWNGTAWTGIGAGVNQFVHALCVYDDGTSAALYAAGKFTTAGGAPALGVARWDGVSWSALGKGLIVPGSAFPGYGLSLCVHDPDGKGPAKALLYVGGYFKKAGDVTSHQVAAWDGANWTGLGVGVGNSATVDTMASMTDAGGPALYVGGTFQTAGGQPAYRVAKWDGATWSAMGPGLGPGVPWGYSELPRAMAVFDDGGGAKLYVGGDFVTAGAGAPMRFITRWNGTSWEDLPGSMWNMVRALLTADLGDGPRLIVGGDFRMAGSKAARYVTTFDGDQWERLGLGLLAEDISQLEVFDDGSGPALYASGFMFLAADEHTVEGIARWSRGRWSAVGGLNSVAPEPGEPMTDVRQLVVHDDGAGPVLLAVGFFVNITAAPYAWGVARWDGRAWTMFSESLNGQPFILEVARFDDGRGARLYGCALDPATSNSDLVRWDGTSWRVVAPVTGSGGFGLRDVDGPFEHRLYAIGFMSAIGGVSVQYHAKWDGSRWVPVPGFDHVSGNFVPFDDGSGPALFAGGSFSIAGGVPASRAARFDGAAWSELGGGLWSPGGYLNAVGPVRVFDDGTGPGLYFAGPFFRAGGPNGLEVNGIARWDKNGWSALGTGLSYSYIYDMAEFRDTSGPALFIGGTISTAGGEPSSYIAKWATCERCYPDCDASGALGVADFTCFQSKYSGGDLYADCNASGNLSVADFGCFQGKYVLGCP
ncbi:MAG: hypothetical protein ACKVU4_00335 [Phycisphaerales bacterium]